MTSAPMNRRLSDQRVIFDHGMSERLAGFARPVGTHDSNQHTDSHTLGFPTCLLDNRRPARQRATAGSRRVRDDRLHSRLLSLSLALHHYALIGTRIPRRCGRLYNFFLSVSPILPMMAAGPITYGACQTACNAGYALCCTQAGAVAGESDRFCVNWLHSLMRA